MENKRSPFSINQDFKIDWRTLSTNAEPSIAGLLGGSQEEDEMLHDIGKIGVITKPQINQIYLNNRKSQLKKLIGLKKIIEHKIIKEDKMIPVYTLGATGIRIVYHDKKYYNVWKSYTQAEVMKKLVFFQLFRRFREMNSNCKVHTPIENEPYTGVIENRGNFFHILIVRGNENEITDFFRWGTPQDRIILVVEHLNYLRPMEDWIKPYYKNIRVTTDFDLKKPFQDMFYVFENNGWIKDMPVRNK